MIRQNYLWDLLQYIQYTQISPWVLWSDPSDKFQLAGGEKRTERTLWGYSHSHLYPLSVTHRNTKAHFPTQEEVLKKKILKGFIVLVPSHRKCSIWSCFSAGGLLKGGGVTWIQQFLVFITANKLGCQCLFLFIYFYFFTLRRWRWLSNMLAEQKQSTLISSIRLVLLLITVVNYWHDN